MNPDTQPDDWFNNEKWDSPTPFDTMFLMEWTQGTAGQTSLEPTSKLLVSHHVGGWDFGDLDLKLNKAKTLYAVDLKVMLYDQTEEQHAERQTDRQTDRIEAVAQRERE